MKWIFWQYCITWFLTLPVFAQTYSQPVLFPQPQQVTYNQGELALKDLSIYIQPASPKDVLFALNELKKIVWDCTGRNIKIVSSPSLASISYSVKMKGFELPAVRDTVGKTSREYYTIHITPKTIHIAATTSAGLYYAVQTIRQLVMGHGSNAVLPAVNIKDSPVLAFRGVMMDFAHGGLLTVEEIKRQIDFLSRWKANQYYFYNEVSIELKGYSTLNYQANYTQQQIKSIIAYAAERHMDVVPFVAFYGHLHELVRNEKYASLAIGKYGHEIDPQNPAVNALLKDWIKQYADIFTSPFIHVGFDETWETKRIAANEKVNFNPEELWIRQLTFVQKELSRYGKTVLTWTDMNNFYPDIIKKLPKEIIPVIWEYSPDTAAINRYLNPVLKEELPFFIQPAVSGWGHIYPSANYTYDNIDLCLKAGIENNTLGFITSVWTDAVEPFVRSSWMFMADGCIGAWQGRVPDKNSFTAAYTAIVYPAIAEEMEKALLDIDSSVTYLEKCLGKNTQGLPRGTIVESWSNPFSAYYLTNTSEHLEDFRNARKKSEEAQEQLMDAFKKSSRKDSSFIHSLLVTTRLINYTATRFIWAYTISNRWNEGMVKKQDDYVIYDLTYSCHGLLADMMDETGELKEVYTKAWLSENMPYRLNNMLGRFDVEYGLWRKLMLKILDYRIQHTPGEPVQSFDVLFKPDF